MSFFGWVNRPMRSIISTSSQLLIWSKYCILLASCTPVSCFLETLINYRHETRKQDTNSNNSHNELEMGHRRDKSFNTTITNSSGDDMSYDYGWTPFSETCASRVSRATPPPHILKGCVTVKADVIVEIEKRLPRCSKPLSEEDSKESRI